MMKKLLFACVFALVATPALADSIVATAKVDGVLVNTSASAGSSLNVVDQSFGPIFNLNTLSVTSQGSLASPGILTTNTFDVNQIIGGTHDLVIDIIATGLTGPNAIRALLSTFSVSGLPSGWSIREQTFINNVLLATTPIFTGVSDSASSINLALLTNPFSAEAIYTIHSVGIGNLNGGIDISVAAVPGPLVGAGIPGLVTGVLSLLGMLGLRRRKKAIALV